MPFQKGNTINKGRIFSPKHRQNISLSHSGKPRIITPEGMESLRRKNGGANSHLWKGGDYAVICKQCSKKFMAKRNGSKENSTKKFCSRKCHYAFRNEGKTKPNKKLRHTRQYKEWREAVFARDGYACTQCGSTNKKGLGMTIYLNADHIQPFALYPEKRFDISNGRTLCEDCHRKTPTFGGQAIYKTNLMTGKLENIA